MKATDNQKEKFKKRSDNFKAAGLCSRCGRKRFKSYTTCKRCFDMQRNWYLKNKKHVSKTHKKYIRRLKLQVFEAYGGAKCSCCGTEYEEFLTLDHIKGNGAEHRKSVKNSISNLYRSIINAGFPKEFRVLCISCNFSYGMYGYCPHKSKSKFK